MFGASWLRPEARAICAGFAGLPKWIARPVECALAEHCEVSAISLPRVPWRRARALAPGLAVRVAPWLTHDLFDRCRLPRCGSLMGCLRRRCALALEVAAIWPDSVGKLVLLAPFGLYDDANPPTDPWAQRGDKVACPDVRESEGALQL